MNINTTNIFKHEREWNFFRAPTLKAHRCTVYT